MRDWSIDYNSVSSEWIDSVSRSDEEWDGYCIVVVHYTNQQGYSNGDLWFWASVDDYEALANAGSVGSEYYYNWANGAMEHHMGQEEDEQYDYLLDDDELMEQDGYYDSYSSSYDEPRVLNQPSTPSPDIKPGILQEVPQEKFSIDGRILRQAKIQQENGTYDEWLDEHYDLGYGDEEFRNQLKFMIEKLESAEELLQRTDQLRMLIQTEQLTTKKMFKTIFRDIENFFGVSIENRIKYGVLNEVLPGKLNPNMYVKYKYKIKQLFDAMENEGITGASKVGARFISAKNPLIRNRIAYKGKEAVRLINQNRKGWLEGEEAIAAIRKFHRKTIRENANMIKKRNSMKLEQKYVSKNGKKVLQVKWRKDATVGRRIITKSKKALNIAKWFVL